MAKKTKLPNYWQLYHNKKGELTFHLLNGNNRNKLIGATEGYKNHQECLDLLDSTNFQHDVFYCSPEFNPLKRRGIEVVVLKELKTYKIFITGVGTVKRRVPIPTPAKAIQMRERTKGVKKK